MGNTCQTQIGQKHISVSAIGSFFFYVGGVAQSTKKLTSQGWSLSIDTLIRSSKTTHVDCVISLLLSFCSFQ